MWQNFAQLYSALFKQNKDRYKKRGAYVSSQKHCWRKCEHMAEKLVNATLAGESNQSTHILLTGKKIPYKDAYKDKATKGLELRWL